MPIDSRSQASAERRRRRFENPVPGAASEPEEVAPFTPPDDDPWSAIDDVARSGRPVVLRSAEGETAEAVYHSTRKFNRSLLKWEGHAFWALRNGAGAPVSFEPVGYRVLE